MEPRSDFYVYILFRADGVTPFYVGKGCGNRCRAHMSPKELARSTHKARVARATVEAIGRIPYTVAFSNLSEADAHAAEAGMIAALGRRSLGTGILCNLTDGGEGAAGAHVSDQRKSALRDLKAGVPLTDAHRMALSAAGSLRPAITEATRAKLSRASRARWSDPDARAKHVASMVAAQNDPTVKARVSAAKVGRTLSADARARIGAAQRGKATSEETRARMSAAAKARWAKAGVSQCA